MTNKDEAKRKDPKYNFLVYLKSKLAEQFKATKAGDNVLFVCPSCRKSLPTALFIADSFRMFCQACSYEGTMLDAVRLLEDDKKTKSNIEIAQYLQSNHNVKLEQFNLDLVEYYFSVYEKAGFDLVPLIKGDKAPFEKDFLNKEHKSKDEWYKWYQSNFNIGIKTGKKSNLTVIDIDTKDIPKVFKEMKNPIVQNTNKGFHFLFQYEEDLPTTRIVDLKIDILNDGKQFVVYPSHIEGKERKWNFNSGELVVPKMSKEIKDFIKSHVKTVVSLDSPLEKLAKDIESGEFNNDLEKILKNHDAVLTQDGNRNNTMIKLGGILRKKMTLPDTEFVLDIVNKNFMSPSLDNKEFNAIIRTLDRYISTDEYGLAVKILEYLKYAEEGTSKDIEQAIGERKVRVDKALSFLLKEKYLVKRGRMFHMIKKILWRDDFPSLSNEVQFKVPYFNDTAIFNWGDLVLLGSLTGYGKTTIAMNMIKRFLDQGITPYYICLETGSRFIKTACNLGIKEGDFKWSIQTDPSKIEIEPNSVTILDWLMIEDKAQTDTVMKYFVEQLVKTNSFLIIFMQLKEGGGWFAPNMVNQFPAYAARYLYDEDSNGASGYWQIDKIRESKRNNKGKTIPCRYDWESKTLRRIDELPEFSTINKQPVKKEETQQDNKSEVAV